MYYFYYIIFGVEIIPCIIYLPIVTHWSNLSGHNGFTLISVYFTMGKFICLELTISNHVIKNYLVIRD